MRRVIPLLAVAVTALAVVAQAAAFTPADPLAAKQWYLQDDHAFDAWTVPPTTLTPVKVAIVDSGLDCSLPDFQGRIADTRSFVGGDPCVDTDGHGTFVAGIIAANLDTQGIVGIAYTSQLLIAKVVRSSDGQIPLEAEAAAIRWAADSGARVINLSLGGVRDPVDPNRDTFSSREAARDRVRLCKGRPPRCCGRQRRRGADRALAVCGLSGCATPRDRRERADALGQRPRLLRPRRDLQRHLGSRRWNLLDVPARAHRAAAALHRSGLLRLRVGRLRQPGGNVVRGASGVCRRRRALRDRPGAHERPGLDDPRALGR